jgi:CBS domain-containing protein
VAHEDEGAVRLGRRAEGDAAGEGPHHVTAAGHPVGIVTDRDLVTRALAHRLSPDARVDMVMTTDLVTMDPDADLREAFRVFDEHAIRRLPLVAADHLVGMLTIDDLVVDTVADLVRLVRPVTGQVLFGHPEASPPALTG